MVIIFCSTLYKDASYKKMTEFLDNNKIKWEGYTSLFDDDGSNKLEELVNKLSNDAKDQNKKKDEKKEDKKSIQSMIIENSESEEDETPKKKKKFIAPEYFIILDDLSNELKDSTLTKLLKQNRHFKSRIILSSQYLNDLAPQARRQIDLLILFQKLPEKKLKEIHKDFDISVNYEQFNTIYKDATKEKFNFLYLDLNTNDFRKNLNIKYEIK
jgi:hypothetical protein